MHASENALLAKTILITGAGRGIGKACALMVHSAGAKVIAVARTQHDLDELSEQCDNQRIETWALDVANHELYERIKSLPELHGLVNNAGTNHVAPMIEQSLENIDSIIGLNIRSLYLVAQSALTPMYKTQGASIVNMSSQMGFVGSPDRTLYCMSKHAVEGLSKAMAVELAEKNIRVNTVAPTFVLTDLTEKMFLNERFKNMVTEMIPLGRLATAEDVACACLYLMSSAASMITGTSIKVDGGWTAR